MLKEGASVFLQDVKIIGYYIVSHIIFVAELTLFSVIFFLIILLIFKKKKSPSPLTIRQAKKNHSSIVITSQDIKAIAGDDMLTTQLDLARAYIELGKKKLAKQMLEHVIKHGNDGQRNAAVQLMNYL
jgi:FimV-like protein